MLDNRLSNDELNISIIVEISDTDNQYTWDTNTIDKYLVI